MATDLDLTLPDPQIVLHRHGAWTLRLVVRHSYLTEAGWRVGGAWWPVMAGEA